MPYFTDEERQIMLWHAVRLERAAEILRDPETDGYEKLKPVRYSCDAADTAIYRLGTDAMLRNEKK